MNLHYHEARQISQGYEQREALRQAESLEEFKESYCDMFDMQDWIYYAEKTGLTVTELRGMARYADDAPLEHNMDILQEILFNY